MPSKEIMVLHKICRYLKEFRKFQITGIDHQLKFRQSNIYIYNVNSIYKINNTLNFIFYILTIRLIKIFELTGDNGTRYPKLTKLFLTTSFLLIV